jgi:hypothetical protein
MFEVISLFRCAEEGRKERRTEGLNSREKEREQGGKEESLWKFKG